MKLVGTLRTIEIDTVRFRKELQAVLNEALVQSAIIWLNATTSVIPTWSGAALSTFRPLSDTINFRLAVNPKSTAPNRTSLGESAGAGSLEIDPSKGRYFFTYSTTLNHLIFNEFNADPSADPNAFAPHSITGTPYGFQEIGRQAWQSFASTVRLPIPQIKVGRVIRMK